MRSHKVKVRPSRLNTKSLKSLKRLRKTKRKLKRIDKNEKKVSILVFEMDTSQTRDKKQTVVDKKKILVRFLSIIMIKKTIMLINALSSKISYSFNNFYICNC